MKIKITEAGWAGYTGHLGMVEFLDGVSIDDVSRGDAASLSAIVSIEDVETGSNPSDAQRIIDQYANEAPVESVVKAAPPAPPAAHTKESLEVIADTKGINGIREIAEPLGLKGNSIHQLIDKILQSVSETAVAPEKA